MEILKTIYGPLLETGLLSKWRDLAYKTKQKATGTKCKEWKASHIFQDTVKDSQTYR